MVIFTFQNNYYDCNPVEEEIDHQSRLLRSHELEEGKEYKVILTNWNGLYRYNINDIVKVTVYYNNTPQIAFIRKGSDTLNITGEKLHINQLIQVGETIKKVYKTEKIILHAVPDYKNMRYEILMHIAPQPSENILKNEIIALIDNKLSEINIEYKQKRQSQRLKPPIIHIMNSKWENEIQKDCLNKNKSDVQHKAKRFSQKKSKTDISHIIHTLS